MGLRFRGLSISEELWAGFMYLHSSTVSYGKGPMTLGSEMITIYHCSSSPEEENALLYGRCQEAQTPYGPPSRGRLIPHGMGGVG